MAQAILVPGAVMPAELACGALLDALGDDVQALAKELEIYAGAAPPAGYTLRTRSTGSWRTADTAGFDRFHLVGYSAGGASSVAFTARHPERLLSVALFEPAWMGNDELSAEEHRIVRESDRIAGLLSHTLEVFAERHHFDPPRPIEPERTATVLRALWERASGWASPSQRVRGRSTSENPDAAALEAGLGRPRGRALGCCARMLRTRRGLEGLPKLTRG